MFIEDYNAPGSVNSTQLDIVPTQWTYYLKRKQGEVYCYKVLILFVTWCNIT